ncbi:L-fuconolactonase [Flavobacterium nitrogenifigens]|uniref:L-fuconolactonase n=2 Tax=Flavobacterium TaxID=237 RepID=A0A7W7IX56_9FLAO|nr:MULTISPECIES: amidohydrolase family protein [Flavobacterium]MBB4802244.1 L-fuconolactonase [Flavobacterium nitrogenifigens]MBB6387202.1 L-fuconolactonase [Flavobacterium notoginsengisoli]
MSKRIDSHQHFWVFDPVRDSWIDETMQNIQRHFLPEDLEPLLKANQFEGCVAVQASQSEEETQFLLDLTSKNDFIKGVVGWIDLRNENIEERLQFFSNQKKLKGFRHVVQGEADDFMDGEEFRRGIKALKPFNYTYDILIFHRQLPAAVRLVKDFPEQRFVIDHIAKPDIKSGSIDSWKKGIEEIAKYDNVWCKISGMVTEADWKNWKPADLKPYLDVIFENFSADKLMYGSDWPVLNVASDYREVVKTLEDYISKFSVEDQNKIWFENANEFYGLK